MNSKLVISIVVGIVIFFLALIIVKAIVFALLKSIVFWIICGVIGAIWYYGKKKNGSDAPKT